MSGRVGRRVQRPQPLKILLAALLGDLAGGAVGPLVVRLVQPLAELLDQIAAVVEPPLLEERAFHPADRILDGSLLVGPVRPAHLRGEAQLQGRVGERGRASAPSSAIR